MKRQRISKAPVLLLDSRQLIKGMIYMPRLFVEEHITHLLDRSQRADRQFGDGKKEAEKKRKGVIDPMASVISMKL